MRGRAPRERDGIPPVLPRRRGLLAPSGEDLEGGEEGQGQAHGGRGQRLDDADTRQNQRWVLLLNAIYGVVQAEKNIDHATFKLGEI